jgi:predicted Rossmann fold flavoprotein
LPSNRLDVLIVGAGAAGVFCAIEAGRGGRRVLLLDHAVRIGKKILISGGGRCNFTNLHTTAGHFLSANPHFAKSALARYTPADFLALVEQHQIPWHEKTLGQLFCDRSASDILTMLERECAAAGVTILPNAHVREVAHDGDFRLETDRGVFSGRSLVIATGGLSIPKMGATSFGFQIAQQFGLAIRPCRPALVPLTFAPEDLTRFAGLPGVSTEVIASAGPGRFREKLLFTHRGLSGPAVLQASSYWQPGETLQIAFAPGTDWPETLARAKATSRRQLGNELATHLPQRLAQAWLARGGLPEDRAMPEVADKPLRQLAESLSAWRIAPSGTEGWKKAEVMAGGVDTREIDSKTMESKRAPGLHFIGEVVDVTGWLGGYNFQWAWASGYACAESLANDKLAQSSISG